MSLAFAFFVPITTSWVLAFLLAMFIAFFAVVLILLSPSISSGMINSIIDNTSVYFFKKGKIYGIYAAESALNVLMLSLKFMSSFKV